jgi:putative transposase
MSSTHVLELALQVSPAAEKTLLARLEAARQVYNACLGEALKRRERLVNNPTYGLARKLSKGKARAQAFADARQMACFSEYALHAYAKQFGHSWLGEHLDSLTIQALASRAYRAVHRYGIGQHGRPRFKGYGRLHAVEGKTNASGIRWTGEGVVWSGLALPVIIDPADPLVTHGLACSVKYVRLVRRQIAGCDRFYAQLVLAGKPYHKDRHPIGQGRVGLDIGPSTLAIVGEHAAFLKQFCAALTDRQRQMRRLERQRDRQRRAGNADNYLPNGQIKPGKLDWHKSSRQRRTDARLAELHRQLAAHRQSLHGQLVNDVLALGDQIYLENLSYRAFQRRFGRSVGADGVCTWRVLQNSYDPSGRVRRDYSWSI